jgi:cytochrome o ubiquinol oxidase subunit IV
MKRVHVDSIGVDRGNLKSCAMGFIFSFVLTVLAFGLAMSSAMSRFSAIFAIIVAAILQVLVHLHYFLHLGRSSEVRWNVVTLLFTLLIMALFVGGTIWIMSHLNYRVL